MCEVTLDNFNTVYEEIEKSINNAKFITIDTEFSALNISKQLQNSLFDSAAERYDKIKSLCEQIIPVQIGLSAFTFDPDNNSYLAHTYTFYTFPRFFFNINPTFLCQSTSLQFLCSYNFDFNKFAYSGVSFLNRLQESQILEYLKNGSFNKIYNQNDNELENILNRCNPIILKWIRSSKDEETLILPEIFEQYKTNLDIRYNIHKALRERFNKQVWTFEEGNQIVLRKVLQEEFDSLTKKCSLDEDFLKNLLGFTRIFRLLVDSKKPLVGHNLFTDLLLLYHRCEKPLPKSYDRFKRELNQLFPHVFDTKCVTFRAQKYIPDNKIWGHNTLSHLYQYFKDGSGRHLALNSPLIQLTNPPSSDCFHNAGWDSYCTGYIFIRMAHILAIDKYENKQFKKFMCSELIGAVADMKNSLNLIRCSVSHIKIDGEDPTSTRPTCLIVESLHRRPVDIMKVATLLSPCGFVEVKPFGGRRAIIAVDNFGSARRILKAFRVHEDFRIQQYNVIKHSPVVRAAMWSGVVVSGAMLMWLASTLKK